MPETPPDVCSKPQTDSSTSEVFEVIGCVTVAVSVIIAGAAAVWLIIHITTDCLKFDSARMDRACKQAEEASGVEYDPPSMVHLAEKLDFHFGDKVLLIKGLYEGRTATVTDYFTEKPYSTRTPAGYVLQVNLPDCKRPTLVGVPASSILMLDKQD